MVLLNDFKRQWADIRSDVLAATEAVGASGWYILGEQVAAFEAELATLWGVPAVIGVASGLDAIEISLKLLGCGPGDRVLTSPISAFATVLAILKTGALPVFVDCDPFGLIDLDACRALLQSRSDVRYFVPVHLYGHALDSSALRALRDDYELKIVEDCAQSIGASASGRPTGAVGHLAATSFYPTKNLGSLGDGGAILCNSTDYSMHARALRDYGQTTKYRHDVIGFNSRLDELQAAYLRHAFLPRFNRWIVRRRQIADFYCGAIQHDHVRVPGMPPYSHSSWHLFPIIVAPAQKRSLLDHLKRMDVAAGEHYPLALVEQKAMLELSTTSGSECPAAKTFCHGEISLPIHPYLSDEEIMRVAGAVNAWKA